jgi:hypothetical protein
MRREPPQVRWRAVLIGGGVALALGLAVSLLAIGLSSEALLLAATPIGLAAGGAAAGRLAGAFGALQGGMVGVLWILAEALADTFGAPSENVLADVAIVLVDAGRIALAAAFGWVGERSLATRSS